MNRYGIGAKLFIVVSVVLFNSLGVLYFARDSINLPQFLHIAFGLVEAKHQGKSNQESLAPDALRSQVEVSHGQKGSETKTNYDVRYTQSNSGIGEHEGPHTYKCVNKIKPPERKTI